MIKYLILCAIRTDQFSDTKYFLLTDENDDTIIFETEIEARMWIWNAVNSEPFAFSYTILCIHDFNYQ